MATAEQSTVRHARRWLTRAASAAESGAEPVRRFVSDRDEAAVAARVDRHGVACRYPITSGAVFAFPGTEQQFWVLMYE